MKRRSLALLLTLFIVPVVTASGVSKSSLMRERAAANSSSGAVNLLLRLKPGADRGELRAFLRQLGSRVAYEYRLLPDLIAVRGVPVHALERLQAHPAVGSVRPDRVRHAMLSESIPLIDADPASMAGFSDGAGVTVCVLDTGFYKSHPAFSGALVAEKDFVNGDGDASDDEGHGTHVAGIVLSRDPVYQGVAPGASLAVGKVLDDEGSGYDSDIMAGIDWCALDAGAQVINLSLGGDSWPGACDFDPLADAVNEAADYGIVVAASSGNGAESHSIASPACASGAIAVGATYDAPLGTRDWCADEGCSQILCTDSDTQPDDVACGSNGSPGLTVVAPGSEITSADGFSEGFVPRSSTSMAAPHVAGLAARLLGERPGFTPGDVRTWIARNAVDLESPGFDDHSGHGRIDALATMLDDTPLTCLLPPECDDGDPCTADDCRGGYCTHSPACDDGDACTVDSCDAGACNSVPAGVDDGLACTDDACDACLGPVHTVIGGNCNHTCPTALPISVGMTVSGRIDADTTNDYDTRCPGFPTPGRDLVYRLHLRPDQAVSIRVTPTTPWDPAVYLLMEGAVGDCDLERCVGGMDLAVAGEPDEMVRVRVPEPGDYYIVVDSFYPGDTGGFTLEIQAACDPWEEGRPCDDGDACTSDDLCVGTVCAGVGGPDCDDGNPCTLDLFDGLNCSNPFASSGAICDDMNPCTSGDLCDGAGGCAGINVCVYSCGGPAGLPCTPDSVCFDVKGDGCSPACGGVDCDGLCAVPAGGGGGGACISSVPCSAGLICIDNPTDGCDPDCGGADCGGTCAAPAGECGGFSGVKCPEGFTCVDDPEDGCDPACGGADCGGLCVADADLPAACGGAARIPCPDGLVCVDDPGDGCDPDCGGADCGGLCVSPCGFPATVQSLGWPDAGFIAWEPLACVDHYNLYRLSAERLFDGNADGLADDYGSCFAPDLPLPEALDPSEPPQGWTHFYLATGESGLGEGSAGTTSDALERTITIPCP